MSVGQSTRNSANYLSNTSVPGSTVYTFAAWFQVALISSNYHVYLSMRGTPATAYFDCLQVNNSTGHIQGYYSTVFSSTIQTVTTNDWIYVALTNDGSANMIVYVGKNGGALSNASVTWGAQGALALAQVLNDNSNNSAAAFAERIRCWTSVLNSTQLTAEMTAPYAVVTANLLWDCPCTTTSDINDHSGGGHNMTITGSLSNGTLVPYIQTSATTAWVVA